VSAGLKKHFLSICAYSCEHGAMRLKNH